MELAAEMEVPMVRTFGGGFKQGAASEIEAVEYVAELLAKVSSQARQLGVSVLLETHDEFSHSAMVRDVLGLISIPEVGSLWDVHHPYRMGESVEETYLNLAPSLQHVHLKDALRNGGD